MQSIRQAYIQNRGPNWMLYITCYIYFPSLLSFFAPSVRFLVFLCVVLLGVVATLSRLPTFHLSFYTYHLVCLANLVSSADGLAQEEKDGKGKEGGKAATPKSYSQEGGQTSRAGVRVSMPRLFC
ncbi:hypothetical protein IWZ00DRAFT_384909 [Phyllosticta capitalensis]